MNISVVKSASVTSETDVVEYAKLACLQAGIITDLAALYVLVESPLALPSPSNGMLDSVGSLV